jgi:hypothetical protein
VSPCARQTSTRQPCERRDRLCTSVNDDREALRAFATPQSRLSIIYTSKPEVYSFLGTATRWPLYSIANWLLNVTPQNMLSSTLSPSYHTFPIPGLYRSTLKPRPSNKFRIIEKRTLLLQPLPPYHLYTPRPIQRPKPLIRPPNRIHIRMTRPTWRMAACRSLSKPPERRQPILQRFRAFRRRRTRGRITRVGEACPGAARALCEVVVCLRGMERVSYGSNPVSKKVCVRAGRRISICLVDATYLRRCSARDCRTCRRTRRCARRPCRRCCIRP